MRNTVLWVVLVSLFYSTGSIRASDLSVSLQQIRALKSTDKTVFVVVPKRINEPFFDDVARGCQLAAQTLGYHCVYYGSAHESARLQVNAIHDLVAIGVDGIALASVQGAKIEPRIKQAIVAWNKPFIAFDTPLQSDISQAFVGTNNYQLGYTLGEYVNQLRPQGGKYCIQYSHADSENHFERMKGIVNGLTNNGLHNDVWIEAFGCPLVYQGDHLRAVRQLKRILKSHSPDVILSTSGGAQYATDAYTELMTPFRQLIESGELIVAYADTSDGQTTLLEHSLSTINAGQRPFEIGTKTLEILDALHRDQAFKKITHTDINICTKQTLPKCIAE